ncbi:MAG: oxygen-independent coproporphyrinogen III oxidase [Gammaproteobacteria bacterium]|nr:oxygen-independent coproporphyrinogen III oxidase [Gammaproteobacteria bacterium]
MQADPVFEPDLIARYDRAGPRYTSYPTAVQFHEQFDTESYIENAHLTNENLVPSPLSLYFHLPFCSTVCYYCACNKIITGNRRHAANYLDFLHHEIKLQAKLFDRDRVVEQLHWGGGTPTFFDSSQMQALMRLTRSEFNLRNDDKGEYSIELDPRECDSDTIENLRLLGFNRISLGVQDFDIAVQKAVNRIQSEEQTYAVIEAARRAQFKSISIDLIYGLPLQNTASFAETLKKVIAMQPNRLSIFNYAHMPDRFKVQKQIKTEDLPDASTKLEIMKNNIQILSDAGYIYIGMDHFAKADDELSLAQNNKAMTRNFQGYTTHAECDVIGLGISAITRIGDCYAQNLHDLEAHQSAVNSNTLPVFRGFKLDNDDLLRQYVINQIICYFELDYQDVQERYLIDFQNYFYNELQILKLMQDDGLLALTDAGIAITPAGRLLVRNVCMIFDKYLKDSARQGIFSKSI